MKKVINSSIDFEKLAIELMNCYPQGNKPGTTHKWRSTTDVIAQKLRTLVAVEDFKFTPKEAIQATINYVSSLDHLIKICYFLGSFLLTTKKSPIDGFSEIDSLFMTYIENNR